MWETAAPEVFKGGDYDPGFTLDLQNKDLQLGYDMARKFKVRSGYESMGRGVKFGHGISFSLFLFLGFS